MTQPKRKPSEGDSPAKPASGTNTITGSHDGGQASPVGSDHIKSPDSSRAGPSKGHRAAKSHQSAAETDSLEAGMGELSRDLRETSARMSTYLKRFYEGHRDESPLNEQVYPSYLFWLQITRQEERVATVRYKLRALNHKMAEPPVNSEPQNDG